MGDDPFAAALGEDWLSEDDHDQTDVIKMLLVT